MFENYFFDGPNKEMENLPIFSVVEDSEIENVKDYPESLALLALKNTVLYPGVVIPITIGREKSINAVKYAEKNKKLIAVTSQKDIKTASPGRNDLFSVGTVARIVKVIEMPDGNTTAILKGRSRFELTEILSNEPYINISYRNLPDVNPSENLEFDATVSSIRDVAKKIIELSAHIPNEATIMLQNIKNNSFLLNFIASNLNLNVKKKQEILEENDFLEKARMILGLMGSELQLLELKDQIDSKVRGGIEKQQRDYFLNQQLKTIQEELGDNPQEAELLALADKAKAKKWDDKVQEAFDKQLNKAKRINPQIAEYSVTLNYLELMLDLPWNEYSEDNFDLDKVIKVLDKDHYGMEKVKARILEHLAVLKLRGDLKAPIICLVGPPGVGKTSLGKSIASALQREFIRMSLGGLHDESEIRGHRKTYIGAMPGRIIQSIKKAGTSNPVFILDEIDKIGKDFRGDPSSALLEVLDPEQNGTFYDNYLELEYDLSKVLFIATANSLSTIQPALLDRMEIIELSGYSTEEKIEIAKKHLVPKQRKEHGLGAKDVTLKPTVISDVIERYTRESGVRSLDRRIAAIMRSTAKKVAMDESYDIAIKIEQLEDILGPTKVSKDAYAKVDTPGVTVGLAWTRVGGDILFVESSLSKGKGKLTLTGNLGDVMKESASTALSYIKGHAAQLEIDPEFFEKHDIHIHVPEGAIPKDGPSAGITMLTALSSLIKDKPVKSHLAMTGEITLRGKVLPVGGIKEKILAAKRAGIKTVMMCAENEKHVNQIKKEYIKGLKFIYVKTMDEVLKHALG